jgi:hypothetical protein
MATVTLDTFIGANRDELISRCKVKVATRTDLPPSSAKSDLGVSVFLDQLVQELRGNKTKTDEISESAIKHGHDLFLRGFTISEVVHDYGDVCQSITDMAVEMKAPISTDDFRTLNRCLDDAIAGAVTEYARESDVPRDGEIHHLWNLTNIALTALEVLRTGNVGVAGSTSAVVHRNLTAIRAALATRMNTDGPSPQSLDEFSIKR